MSEQSMTIGRAMGGRDKERELDKLLSEKQMKQIKEKYPLFIFNMVSLDIISTCVSENLCTISDKEKLKGMKTDTERADYLLREVIMRSPQRAFMRFKAILEKRQPKLAALIPAVDMDEMEENSPEIQNLVMEMKKSLQRKREAEANLLYEVMVDAAEKLINFIPIHDAVYYLYSKMVIENKQMETLQSKPGPSSKAEELFFGVLFNAKNRDWVFHLCHFLQIEARHLFDHLVEIVHKAAGQKSCRGVPFQFFGAVARDGIFEWKIHNYTQRKQEAVSGRALSVCSPPVYIYHFGYKVCARVYLNGDGKGKGSHMSLEFVIMKGDYDDLLPWPFSQKVTMALVDQDTGRDYISENLRPDPTSSSFRPPIPEMIVALGAPLLAEQSLVESKTYLKDNTIIIKVGVEMPDI